jgi:hypothetical protein
LKWIFCCLWFWSVSDKIQSFQHPGVFAIDTMDSLQLDKTLTLLPVVHGSASYAVAVRRYLLGHRFDCIAIPLPASFQSAVIAGIEKLPNPSAVVQMESSSADNGYQDLDGEELSEQTGSDQTGSEKPRATYVPIDPCQAVIAAIRFAIMDRTPVKFIDEESRGFEVEQSLFPDPFALETTTIERFCAASLPAIPRPNSVQRKRRIVHMAYQLMKWKRTYKNLVCLCDLQDWPWLRDAIRSLEAEETLRFESALGSQSLSEHDIEPAENYAVDPRTLLFLMGELPFITGLYERARESLDDDASIVVDGLKELLVSTRQSYLADLGNRARKITPLLLSQCLKYIRNQTLLERRFTPSFYTIAHSAQQVMGDQYTIHLVDAAKNYPYDDPMDWPMLRMGIDQAHIPGHSLVAMTSRLPGPPEEWHSLELNRPAKKMDKKKWKMRWNPFQQCSWPEEDVRIESFRNRILERAQGLIGADLARTEKFTTSMMDGLDLRETLRHWYDGSLYVKIQPPSVGHLDGTVMLFDNEPDPQEYSWRATWFAEHDEESTLAFYATPFQNEMLGPGVAVSTYGGAMFLYPPRHIEDIWEDERLDFADTLEQRLVAAVCMHSESRHIALLSWTAPGFALKKIAKLFKKSLVHVPLGHFSDSVVQQLRTFHVLNGQHVRSYAAHFIRKA